MCSEKLKSCRKVFELNSLDQTQAAGCYSAACNLDPPIILQSNKRQPPRHTARKYLWSACPVVIEQLCRSVDLCQLWPKMRKKIK